MGAAGVQVVRAVAMDGNAEIVAASVGRPDGGVEVFRVGHGREVNHMDVVPLVL